MDVKESGMKLYRALDVSLRWVSICIVDEAGEVRHEAKVAADVDTIVVSLRNFSEAVKMVEFEAGALSNTSPMACKQPVSRSCASRRVR
jgi:hypothetical protein